MASYAKSVSGRLSIPESWAYKPHRQIGLETDTSAGVIKHFKFTRSFG